MVDGVSFSHCGSPVADDVVTAYVLDNMMVSKLIVQQAPQVGYSCGHRFEGECHRKWG